MDVWVPGGLLKAEKSTSLTAGVSFPVRVIFNDVTAFSVLIFVSTVLQMVTTAEDKTHYGVNRSF